MFNHALPLCTHHRLLAGTLHCTYTLSQATLHCNIEAYFFCKEKGGPPAAILAVYDPPFFEGSVCVSNSCSDSWRTWIHLPVCRKNNRSRAQPRCDPVRNCSLRHYACSSSHGSQSHCSSPSWWIPPQKIDLQSLAPLVCPHRRLLCCQFVQLLCRKKIQAFIRICSIFPSGSRFPEGSRTILSPSQSERNNGTTQDEPAQCSRNKNKKPKSPQICHCLSPTLERLFSEPAFARTIVCDSRIQHNSAKCKGNNEFLFVFF